VGSEDSTRVPKTLPTLYLQDPASFISHRRRLVLRWTSRHGNPRQFARTPAADARRRVRHHESAKARKHEHGAVPACFRPFAFSWLSSCWL